MKAPAIKVCIGRRPLLVTCTNPDPAMYRANIATANKNTYGVSSYMVNDASYFRCTNITSNYSLPQKW